MAKRFKITLVRTVTETLSFHVDARTKHDAAMQAGIANRDTSWEWDRDEGDTRVKSVDRDDAPAPEPAGDPMEIPAILKRAAS